MCGTYVITHMYNSSLGRELDREGGMHKTQKVVFVCACHVLSLFYYYYY